MLYKTSLPTSITVDSNETSSGALNLLAFFLFVIHHKITGPIIEALYPFTPFAWIANWRYEKVQAITELKCAQAKLEKKTRIETVLSVMFPTWSSISLCVETPTGIVLPKGEKSYEFREKIFCASLHELVRITHSEDAPCIHMVNPYFKSALRILEHIVSSPVEFNQHKEKAHQMFGKLYAEILPLTTYKNYSDALTTISKLSPTLFERAQR